MEVLSLATPKSPFALLILWSSTLKCIRWNEKVHLGCSMLCFLQNLLWCRIVLDWVGRAIIIYFKLVPHSLYLRIPSLLNQLFYFKSINMSCALQAYRSLFVVSSKSVLQSLLLIKRDLHFAALLVLDECCHYGAC